MLEFYRKLFQYDHWANTQVAENLGQVADKEEPLKYLAHVLAAQKVWLERLRLNPEPAKNVWPTLDLPLALAYINELQQDWSAYLHSLTPENLTDEITYRNIGGKEFGNNLGDILTHVIIHSAYHRAQAALKVRASGDKPAVTDFIAYCRMVQ